MFFFVAVLHIGRNKIYSFPIQPCHFFLSAVLRSSDLLVMFFFVAVLKERQNMLSVFLSSYRNNREILGELKKAVEALVCGSCSHSISRFLKHLLDVFLLDNWTMSSRFL